MTFKGDLYANGCMNGLIQPQIDFYTSSKAMNYKDAIDTKFFGNRKINGYFHSKDIFN